MSSQSQRRPGVARQIIRIIIIIITIMIIVIIILIIILLLLLLIIIITITTINIIITTIIILLPRGLLSRESQRRPGVARQISTPWRSWKAFARYSNII